MNITTHIFLNKMSLNYKMYFQHTVIKYQIQMLCNLQLKYK